MSSRGKAMKVAPKSKAAARKTVKTIGKPRVTVAGKKQAASSEDVIGCDTDDEDGTKRRLERRTFELPRTEEGPDDEYISDCSSCTCSLERELDMLLEDDEDVEAHSTDETFGIACTEEEPDDDFRPGLSHEAILGQRVNFKLFQQARNGVSVRVAGRSAGQQLATTDGGVLSIAGTEALQGIASGFAQVVGTKSADAALIATGVFSAWGRNRRGILGGGLEDDTVAAIPAIVRTARGLRVRLEGGCIVQPTRALSSSIVVSCWGM